MVRFYESFEPDSTSEENADGVGCEVAIDNDSSAISHLLFDPLLIEPDSTSEEQPKKKKKSNSEQSVQAVGSESNFEKLPQKPFQCPFPGCSYRVSHKRNLFRHKRQTHGTMTPQGIRFVNRHVCNICGKKNLNYDNFKRHHQLNHDDVPEDFTIKSLEIVQNADE